MDPISAYIDIPTVALTGTSLTQLFQQVGNCPTLLYGVTIVNNTRPTADPRPCYWLICEDRGGGAMNWGVKYTARFNNANWYFANPLVIPKGDFVRMVVYGETGDECGFQYASSAALKNLGGTHG